MHRVFASFVLGVCIVVALGCGKSEPPQATVKGKVTLDGKSLDEGEIILVIPGNPPSAMTIKDGEYSGKALVGKNSVEIRAFKTGPPLSTDPTGAPTKMNYIPDRFNGHTTLEADVKAGANDLPTFPVTSK